MDNRVLGRKIWCSSKRLAQGTWAGGFEDFSFQKNVKMCARTGASFSQLLGKRSLQFACFTTEIRFGEISQNSRKLVSSPTPLLPNATLSNRRIYPTVLANFEPS